MIHQYGNDVFIPLAYYQKVHIDVERLIGHHLRELATYVLYFSVVLSSTQKM